MSAEVQISRMESQATDLTAQARTLTITTPEEAEHAAAFGKSIRTLRKDVADYWNNEESGPTALAHRAWKASVAKRDAMLKPLDEADKQVSRVIAAWTLEQERIAAEAKRKADEEARRQRAEEIKAAAAEARKQGADKEDVAILREQMKAAPIQTATIAAPTKPSGVSTPRGWAGRLAGATEQEQAANLMLLVKAIAAGKVPISLLKLDGAALNKWAKATEGKVPTPGVEFYQTTGNVRYR